MRYEMEYIEINDFIWDKFNLPLDEDINATDYYTVEDLKKLVEERIKELQKLGYKITSGLIVEYEIRDTKEITAGAKSVADNQYLFVISKYMARHKNDKYMDTVIYHELCHILQLEYLFNNAMIFYTDGKLKASQDNRSYVTQMLQTNGAHTPLWYAFVNKVNRTLLVNPPVAETLEEKDLVDIFLESLITTEEFMEIDPWIYD